MEKYSMELDHDNNLVRVRAWGKLKKEEGIKIIIEARKLALRHDFDIYYDVRQLELEGAKPHDFYYLPREREVFSKPGTKKTSVAIVASAVNDRMSDYKFYENVTHNLGYRVRIFTSDSEAELWLKHQRE